MLQRARALIQHECSTHNATLDIDVVATLGLNVNSFYLNLSGALDNLAWSLVHEFSLTANVDENKRQHQQLAQLSSDKFVRELSLTRPAIAERVVLSRKWFSDLKRLRDPAAHRLPLTVVAGVLTADDSRRIKALQEAANDALQADDVEEYVRLLNESYTVGTFMPWLVTPAGFGEGYFVLPNLIASDNAFFLDLVGAVAKMILSERGVRTMSEVSWHVREPSAGWRIGSYVLQYAPWPTRRRYFGEDEVAKPRWSTTPSG